jgi:predicted RecA/RadA family phage recombinase
MTTTYLQSGVVVERSAPAGGITAGQGLQYGAAGFGIALNTAAAGLPVQLRTEGIFTVAKATNLAITLGDRLYWDPAAKVVNKTPTNNLCVGIAESTASASAATVAMRITPSTPAGT